MKNLFIKNCCDGLYNSIDVHFTSICESTLKASVMDGVKMGFKLINKKEANYKVIYGNGTPTKGWI
jgi:hypothetical protein